MTLWSSNNPKPICVSRWDQIGLVVVCLLGFPPPTCVAYATAYAPSQVLFPFQGKIDFRQKQFLLSVNKDNNDSLSIAVTRDAVNENQFHLTVNINHLRTSVFDISSVLECPLELTKNPDGQFRGLSGKLWSQYTLINYQPVRELSGNFEIKDNTFFINSLVIGNLSGGGSVKFAEPYTIDLALNLAQIDVSDFFHFWTKDEKNPWAASGQLSGKLALSGPLNHLQIRGNFGAYNGAIKDSLFENLLINFEGIYPIVALINSTGAKPDGFTFNIVGNIDLSNRQNFVQQIRSLSKQPIVQKEGENLEWTLKRIKTEQGGNTTTELKYLKKQGTETGSKPDEEDMLGVERSIKF